MLSLNKSRYGAISLSAAILAASIPVLMVAGCGKEQNSVPLEYGWGYACAITNDAKDRARRQQDVALAYLDYGNIDRSIEMGKQIENWRKAVVMGKSAGRLAFKGRDSEAERLINQAKRFIFAQTETDDWRRSRALMHISEAQAYLGQHEELASLEKAVQGDGNEFGRVRANLALFHALHGDAGKAMELMDSVAANSPLYDELIWRIRGYLRLVKTERLSGEQEKTAIERAFDSVSKMPGNKKLDLMLMTAETAWNVGLDEDHGFLKAATGEIRDCMFPPNIKALLMAEAMVAWAKRGEKDKVAELAELTRNPELFESLLTTDGSRFFSLLGEARHIAGNPSEALGHFRKAIEITEKQPNIRPRAMAAVSVCLSAHRCDFDFDKLKKDMDRLAEGLNAQAL